jgi:hypothetical protein
MERKVDVRWQPMLEEFQKANALLASSRATSAGLRLKTDFDIKMLQRKWQTFRELYQKVKKECKVGRHQLPGETGAASEGQPTTAQQAIDNATNKWPLFADFHAAFGEVQRLRDDTYKETTSPYKPLQEACGAEVQAIVPRSAPRRAAAKRLRLEELSEEEEPIEVECDKAGTQEMGIDNIPDSGEVLTPVSQSAAGDSSMLNA